MHTMMNLPTGHTRWKGVHAADAKGRCRCCRCESRFVASRRGGTAEDEEDLCEKRSRHVRRGRNDDGGVAPLTRNGTKRVVAQGCWTAAPGDGDRNGCSNRSAYGNESYSSPLAELLVAARVAK
jgi:hypothetical protein